MRIGIIYWKAGGGFYILLLLFIFLKGKTKMGDTILEESIFQKIVDSSTKLKSGFNKYLKKICIEHNFNFDNGFELGIDTMIEELIFGIESKSDNLYTNLGKVNIS